MKLLLFLFALTKHENKDVVIKIKTHLKIEYFTDKNAFN